MRLSEWRAKAPSKEGGGPKVAAVVDAVINALGAEPDPHCWVAWGEDPAIKYAILVPTELGLITSFVRVNVPGEGPRATTKLIRWSRVAIGELAVESQAGHRLLSFQVEQQVLRGADEAADRVAAFALRVLAGVEGRSIPPSAERPGRAARARKPVGGKAASRPGAGKAGQPAGPKPSRPNPGRPSATSAAVRSRGPAT
jgi:hypothetical protein